MNFWYHFMSLNMSFCNSIISMNSIIIRFALLLQRYLKLWPDLRKAGFHTHNSKTHFSPSKNSCTHWLTRQAGIYWCWKLPWLLSRWLVSEACQMSTSAQVTFKWLHIPNTLRTLETKFEGPRFAEFTPRPAVALWWKDCKITDCKITRINQFSRKEYSLCEGRSSTALTELSEQSDSESPEVTFCLKEWNMYVLCR